MNKGCDKMRYGTCQYYKEHVEKTVGGPFPAMEYGCYCNTFDKWEQCPYYSYKNFDNQQIRNNYKKNKEGDAKGSMIALIIIIVLIVFGLKSCGVF